MQIKSYDTLLTHPYSTQAKNPLAYPLYNLDKYCKISVIGGLAQLVEQRTLKKYLIDEIVLYMRFGKRL